MKIGSFCNRLFFSTELNLAMSRSFIAKGLIVCAQIDKLTNQYTRRAFLNSSISRISRQNVSAWR